MIGIIGAMGVEVEALKRLMENSVSQRISGIEFTRGKIAGTDIVVAACGIGKVFAAVCTEIMIMRYSPYYIINTGVAGTLTKELSVGDIAVAADVVQYDMDTTALGDAPGLISGINIVNIPCDGALVKLIEKSAEEEGFCCRLGTVATGDCFVGDVRKKAWIADTFGAVACEMEGAAIGQVCYVNRIPFAVIRAISDGADGDSEEDYTAFLAKAAANSIKVLRRVLKVL